MNSNNIGNPNEDLQNESLLSLSTAIDDSMKCEILANDNPFPIESFPKLFSDFIVDLNKSLKFPHDYTGTAMLTAISCAIGTKVKLKVKESLELINHGFSKSSTETRKNAKMGHCQVPNFDALLCK